MTATLHEAPKGTEVETPRTHADPGASRRGCGPAAIARATQGSPLEGFRRRGPAVARRWTADQPRDERPGIPERDSAPSGSAGRQ